MSYKCIRAGRGQAHGREDRDLAQTKTHTGLGRHPIRLTSTCCYRGTDTQSLLRPRMGTLVNL